ncbi:MULTISPECIES: hypothetical protein [unclassified Modicisalibacter]|uniref:hypothetical protein n=1 Tax=unclassified Modicisalibacter TaxID=2679913 RepID=UPI001CCB15A2|nr:MULTISPECIES: hypothetical protein [unclassified Modicisalibacter]MBZ9557899.1 hypothetical protein [Modicisalibacter sp. R2A 31.J]MBZ9573434.1 hypothetical protein [Modicisalibacter sp. MOD 31.J]
MMIPTLIDVKRSAKSEVQNIITANNVMQWSLRGNTVVRGVYVDRGDIIDATIAHAPAQHGHDAMRAQMPAESLFRQ